MLDVYSTHSLRLIVGDTGKGKDNWSVIFSNFAWVRYNHWQMRDSEKQRNSCEARGEIGVRTPVFISMLNEIRSNKKSKRAGGGL